MFIEGVEITLPGKLHHYVTFNGNYIAIFDVDGVSVFHRRRNVMAFDKSGTMIWQIDPAAYVDDFINYYNGMGVEGDQIVLTTFAAEKTLLAVDPKTGRVTRADGGSLLLEEDRSGRSIRGENSGNNNSAFEIAGSRIALHAPVKYSFTLGNVVVILLDSQGLGVRDYRRNVLGYSTSGEFLWEIQPAMYINDILNTYTDGRIENGQLVLGSWASDRVEFVLNPKTGRLKFTNGGDVHDQEDRPKGPGRGELE